MWNTVLYCIVLYCIVLYCTVLFKYVIFHIWNTVLVSDQSQLFVAKYKQKCTHVLCSTVQYMYSSVQCSDRARGGWICDSREMKSVRMWRNCRRKLRLRRRWDMRYYFVIFLAERSFYRKAKGRGKNSRFFQTLAKMGFFFIFGLDLGGGKGDCRFFESHRRFSCLPFPLAS